MTTRTRRSTRRWAAPAAAATVGLALALAGCADDTPDMPGMGSSTSPHASGSAASSQFNEADVTFAQMMIPHHQQAVTMSDMLLAKSGVNADVVALAKQVKAAQQPEITTMEGWLKAWGQPMSAAPGGMDHGGGDMMSPDEMEALDSADGSMGQRLYLEGMIEHHRGAVGMAEDEINNGTNADAKKLAETIRTTQNAEIETMEKLLAAL